MLCCDQYRETIIRHFIKALLKGDYMLLVLLKCYFLRPASNKKCEQTHVGFASTHNTYDENQTPNCRGLQHEKKEIRRNFQCFRDSLKDKNCVLSEIFRDQRTDAVMRAMHDSQTDYTYLRYLLLLLPTRYAQPSARSSALIASFCIPRLSPNSWRLILK